MITSPDEREQIKQITGMQKKVVDTAVQLITIRDVEGDFGEMTQSTLKDFLSQLKTFISLIESFGDLQEKRINLLIDESKQTSVKANEIGSLVVEAGMKAVKVLTSVVVIVLILGSIISFFIAQSISTPIKATVELAEKISSGDISVPDIDIMSQDEIGLLATALNAMKKKPGYNDI